MRDVDEEGGRASEAGSGGRGHVALQQQSGLRIATQRRRSAGHHARRARRDPREAGRDGSRAQPAAPEANSPESRRPRC